MARCTRSDAVTEDDRPVVLRFVSYPVTPDVWTAPALVDLQTAFDLQLRGWMCVGPDPNSVAALEEWLIAQEWLKRLA